ncbi:MULTISPECIES: hypothetical protein [unclassified Microbacterium]|uniref:hypothetical protein n=1 Tax=unclassified Microbacterium TaxID=2609290 RepID=UPI0028ACD62E|nr:hypothetical protein [Microbacterium sp.]
MSAESVIGPILIVIGLALMIFRRSVSQIFHHGVERMYGEPLADDAMPPGRTPMRMLIVGILFIGFGIFTLVGALLR